MKLSHSSHPSADTVFSPGLCRLAWLNIAVQATCPLVVAFTPVIAGADEQHFLQQPAPLTAQRAQVYTLGAGETAASVAKKFSITLPALRKLNQFRTFAHGFDNMRAGDQLDVPAPQGKSPFSDDADRSVTTTADATSSRLAGDAQTLGNLMSSDHPGSTAADMARGMATGAASDAVQQWMNKFGTAQVNLNMDDKGSLDNSSIDWLIPLYDSPSSMLFTQLGARNKDSRNTLNLGWGVRWFTTDWMYGFNNFFDNDITGHNRRTGLGLEARRDYLQLAGNTYIGLTDWHQSRDFDDYDERPANGFDLRAQGWLPAYPQLGGKLTYEQYYGDEVALFGKDDRQKNPRAVTAGLNWTPFPLLTMGVDERLGQSGKNETSLNMQVTYRPDQSLSSQLSTDSVDATRRLGMSRYDLVDRNNNIVLEYRKQTLLRLKTADLVTGYPGEQKSLNVTVSSKYGLDRIDWTAPALLAAGGQIVQNSSKGDYSVVMPAWQSTAGSVNNYTVTGVAVDRKGNRSEPSETQISVNAPGINTNNSTFSPEKSQLPSDGRSTQALTLTLKSDQGQVVDVPVADITFTRQSQTKTAGGNSHLTLSDPVRQSVGVYALTATAGTTPESVIVTPHVRGLTLQASTITVSDTTPDGSQSTFGAAPGTIAADDTATSTLTFKAEDVHGNAIAGIAGQLSLSVRDASGATPAAGKVTVSSLTEGRTPGTYTATLKGTLAGAYTVTPQFSGSAVGSLSATVTLTAGTADASQSTLAASPDSITAGGTSTVTLTLKDVHGNPVTGQTLTLTGTGLAAAPALAEGGTPGIYTATVTLTVAGAKTLDVGGLTGFSKPATLTVTPAKFAGMTVNGHDFAEADGFPTTGFAGAHFTMKVSAGQLSDYTWSADQSWVSVSAGVVTINSAPAAGSKTVTITATPAGATGVSQRYTFTLSKWFTNNGQTQMNWPSADAYCSSRGGLPTRAELTSGQGVRNGSSGALYAEWGDMGSYSSFASGFYWTSEADGSSGHFSVGLGSGDVYSVGDMGGEYVVCLQGF